jgi:hypothetical protein
MELWFFEQKVFLMGKAWMEHKSTASLLATEEEEQDPAATSTD